MTAEEAIVTVLAENPAERVQAMLASGALDRVVSRLMGEHGETEQISPDSQEANEAATTDDLQMRRAAAVWQQLTDAQQQQLSQIADAKASDGRQMAIGLGLYEPI